MCRSNWKSAEKQHFHDPMGEMKAQLAAVFINSELISFPEATYSELAGCLFQITPLLFHFVMYSCFYSNSAPGGKKDAEEKTHTSGTED